MIIEHTCKYPGCCYYNKKAKHYCCGACANDHYDYGRLKKENVMGEIKREWSYKTSDGRFFTGKSAAKKAKEYQKRLNFRENVKNIIPQARKIFDIEKIRDEAFLVKTNDEFGWDNDNFEDFLYQLVTIYLEIPELSKFFQFIEEKFDGNKRG